MKLELLLDLEKGRARRYSFRSELYVGEAKFIPRHSTRVFDGKDYRTYEPRDQNTTTDFSLPELQPDVQDGEKGGRGVAI